jgi:hypothetical protein
MFVVVLSGSELKISLRPDIFKFGSKVEVVGRKGLLSILISLLIGGEDRILKPLAGPEVY